MKKLKHHDYFTVPVWSRDCEIPEHRVFDVDYRLVKCCDLCEVYRESFPMDFVREHLHPLWMDINS
jgi:hypothetical protein